MSNLIPIKIAELALEEKDKEIARLKAEVEELKALTSEMDSTINVSQAACREYKAEVERLEEIVGSDAIDRKYGMCCDASAEVARLKAEIERLTAFTTRTIIPNEELQAQVERLTKAGDAMGVHLAGCYRSEGYDPQDCRAIDIWNAAKEGKQP